MAFGLPEQITPTPPPNQRPIPTGAPNAWNPSARPYADPDAGAAQDDQFTGPLDEVHRIWSNALDDGANAPQQGQPGQGTPFYDDLRKSTAVPAWKPLAERVGANTGVPPDVLLGLVDVTSGGDPAAQLAGGKAGGLAGVPLHQLPPGADPHDPAVNLETAARRVAEAHAKTGDWDKAAAAATGFASPDGRPRVLGQGVDGFDWARRFKTARERYGR